MEGSRIITLSEGTKIKYHPNLTFSPEIRNKFSGEERAMLREDQATETVTPGRGGRGGGGGGQGYSGRGGYQKRKIEQLEQQVWELRSQASEQVPEHVDTQPGRGNTGSLVSQVTINEGSFIGGRSDQAKQRQRQGQGG